MVDDITELFIPHLLEFRVRSFTEAVQFAAQLPTFIGGRLVNAARCAVELAILDLAGRAFHRRVADATAWPEMEALDPPGSLNVVRYSGVVVGRAGLILGAALRAQRFYGLRDFKIKVGVAGWQRAAGASAPHSARSHAQWPGYVARRRKRGVVAGAGAGRPCRFWTAAASRPSSSRSPPGHDEYLPELASLTQCDLIVDESLLTIEDAEALIEGGGVRVLNVRIAKNGGLLPSLHIAQMALAVGLDVTTRLPGRRDQHPECRRSSILESCPQVRYVEGAYGRWLLRGDVTRNRSGCGRGGRMRPLPGYGLGVDVSSSQLKRITGVPIPP